MIWLVWGLLICVWTLIVAFWALIRANRSLRRSLYRVTEVRRGRDD